MPDRYAGLATFICEHCHILEICCRFRLHRQSLAVSLVRALTTVTVCCTAHQIKLYRNYSEFRTISQESCCKFRDAHMHHHCYISFIGYQLSSESLYKLSLITYKARAQSTPSY